MYFPPYVHHSVQLYVCLFFRLSINFFILNNINIYTICCEDFQNIILLLTKPSSSLADPERLYFFTGYACTFFFYSVLYCVLLIFDTWCDNRNQVPPEGAPQRPRRPLSGHGPPSQDGGLFLYMALLLLAFYMQTAGPANICTLKCFMSKHILLFIIKVVIT